MGCRGIPLSTAIDERPNGSKKLLSEVYGSDSRASAAIVQATARWWGDRTRSDVC